MEQNELIKTIVERVQTSRTNIIKAGQAELNVYAHAHTDLEESLMQFER